MATITIAYCRWRAVIRDPNIHASTVSSPCDKSRAEPVRLRPRLKQEIFIPIPLPLRNTGLKRANSRRMYMYIYLRQT